MFRTGRKKELRDVIVLEFCCFCTDATTKILTVETSLSVHCPSSMQQDLGRNPN